MQKVMVVVVVVAMLLGSSAANADKLSDFKDANRYSEGCDTIPALYSSDRSACERENPKVHSTCDGTSSYPTSCGTERETRDAKALIDKIKRDIGDLKDKKSRAESNKSSASSEDDKKKFENEISDLEKQIYEKGKDLDAAERALEERKQLIDSAIYNIDKCLDVRGAVSAAFMHALDTMRNENETPEIKDLAYSLASKYKAQRDGHEEMIKNVKTARQNCKDWRP